jgi:ubiquinone biosynthesis protein UbiJ
MKITTEMKQQIQQKEQLTNKLNKLCKQLVALEIKEGNKRASLMTELTNSGEKMTEKVKVAKCDEALKSEINQIAHLKNDVASLKREIDLCNDKISLCRNMIRELEITTL